MDDEKRYAQHCPLYLYCYCALDLFGLDPRLDRQFIHHVLVELIRKERELSIMLKMKVLPGIAYNFSLARI